MFARLFRRARRAVPSWQTALGGSLLWAAAILASARINLAFSGWQSPEGIWTVLALYAVAPLLAFAPALWLARFLSDGRRYEVRVAAHVVALGVCTLVALSVLFGLEYRAYYAQWHDEPLTRLWLVQFVFTGAASTYHFAVLGLRLLVPIGFIALLVTAIAHAHRPR